MYALCWCFPLSFVLSFLQETIIVMFGHDTEPAFSWYNVMYCLGFVVQSAIASGAMSQGIEVLAPITYGWFVLGVIGYIVLRALMPEPETESDGSAK